MNQKPLKSRSFRDLEVWKLSIDFIKHIYQLTTKFPNSEQYGLTAQLRRSAISIPSNIAEGQGRNSSKEFKQFLAFALGSLAELETQLIIANEVNFLADNELSPLLDKSRCHQKNDPSSFHELEMTYQWGREWLLQKTENRKQKTAGL